MMQRFANLGRIGLGWPMVALLMSVAVGCAVAFFLWSLDRTIELFWQNGWLLYLLPLAGLVSGLIYRRYGKDCEAGNSLIYLEIFHRLQKPMCESTRIADLAQATDQASDGRSNTNIPPRMCLLVLMGTLITHLCGGSAGREGTAVQMGGSIASWFIQRSKISGQYQAFLLQSGIAAGFGAVFGTPLAAAIFAIEVVGLKLLYLRSFSMAVVCALTADLVVSALGITHTKFNLPPSDVVFSLNALLSISLAGVAFGLATGLFLFLTGRIKSLLVRLNVHTALRPVIGGVVIILLVLATGRTDYLGLGVKASPLEPDNVCIESSFERGDLGEISWLSKLTFTSITLGSGLKGGEATPLFYMGSTLGNALSPLVKLPISILAAIGLVAMFAAATRTPFACTMMAVELYDLPLSASMQLAALTLVACLIAVSVRDFLIKTA